MPRDVHGPATTLIHAGTLLAKPGEEPEAKQTIRIEGARIASVESGFTPPKADETLIDLSESYNLQ